MIRKIKKIISDNRLSQKNQTDLLREIEWAHIYHDSIRGKFWLENLSLNIGRWAGNYAFFYVLNRVLSDYKPKSILELGLGESSKFVSEFLNHDLKDSKHTIIEQDENWKESFTSNFNLCERSKIIVCKMEKVLVKGYHVNMYKGLEKNLNEHYDLYIIDGPHGSSRFSRFNIVEIINNKSTINDLIIIIDDFNRQGEKDTANELLKIFEKKKIRVFSAVYHGNKSLLVIATEKYKYLASL